MAKNNISVYYAKNMSDVFYNIKNVSGLHIVSGCTLCGRTEDGWRCALPDSVLTIRTVPELKTIVKTERSVSFGAAVTLSEIIELGPKRGSAALYEAARKTANFSVRNIATIGGTICALNTHCSLYSALLASDAILEFKSQKETKIIPFSKFTTLPEGFLLTEVKVPLDAWDISLYKRLGPAGKLTKKSASFCFLAETPRNILGNIKIVYAGKKSIRSREIENKLIGSRLPINTHTIDLILQEYLQLFDKTGEEDYESFEKWQFQNLLRDAFSHLTVQKSFTL